MTSRPAENQPTVRVGAGWSPLYADGLADGRLLAFADALEELGCDSLWISDASANGGPAPLPALAAVAGRTSRLKLGTNVLVLPPRNPLTLARELATLDAVSGGRLLAAGGLGTGVPAELEALGLTAAERAPRLEESIAILKALWRGAPVTHAGRFWSLSGVQLHPRPVQPELELWLGGRAPAALRRIGRLADGWLGVFVSPEEFGAMVAIIRDAAAQAGRTIDADHYGTTLFAAPGQDALPPGAEYLIGVRPDLAREDHIAYGAAELRELLERFIAQGASKFVVSPLTTGDLIGWTRELWDEAIAPVQERYALAS
jgi:probable F420-dependent oxidoreductase